MIIKLNESVNEADASKKFISQELNGIKDKGFSNVLRKIIFGSDVDWNKVPDIIKENMPEVDIK